MAGAFYIDSWEEVFARLPVDHSSYLIIVTRGHKYDLACLRFALGTPARYIGLLGSRRKTRLLFETLEREGVDPGCFDRVFAPVGLEIGSETPEEIAVSIAAELVAVRKNLDIRPLKESLRHLRPVAQTSQSS
jgi:xanthine dehydrogenase accessory factor